MQSVHYQISLNFIDCLLVYLELLGKDFAIYLPKQKTQKWVNNEPKMRESSVLWWLKKGRRPKNNTHPVTKSTRVHLATITPNGRDLSKDLAQAINP